MHASISARNRGHADASSSSRWLALSRPASPLEVRLGSGGGDLAVSRRQGADVLVDLAADRGCDARPEAFVCSDADGTTAWKPNRVTKAFVRHGRAAGLRPFRLHDLRHIMATEMLHAGAPPRHRLRPLRPLLRAHPRSHPAVPGPHGTAQRGHPRVGLRRSRS